jgi:hypothetical protein
MRCNRSVSPVPQITVPHPEHREALVTMTGPAKIVTVARYSPHRRHPILASIGHPFRPRHYASWLRPHLAVHFEGSPLGDWASINQFT